jgi:membrane protein DedA with SNARE-associated domain
MLHNVLDPIIAWIGGIVASWGYVGVALLMAIESANVPLPSEAILPFAGYLVSQGKLNFHGAALAGAIGCVLGSLPSYLLGLYGGRPFLEKRGRWFHLGPDRMARAERWFDRWDDWAVFIGRLTPLARSFISIPAGVFEHPFVRYTVLTAIGSAIWAFGFAGAGYALGANWEELHHAFRYVEYLIALAIVALVAYLIVRRRRSSTMGRRATDSAR